jgi:hypothetical protein
MLIAKIEDGQVVAVADYREFFPNTSFANSGPNAEFMAENKCMPINMFLEHNQKTHVLEPTEPYIMGDWVYTVKVSELPEPVLENNEQTSTDLMPATTIS